jgi:hypothetical protein
VQIYQVIDNMAHAITRNDAQPEVNLAYVERRLDQTANTYAAYSPTAGKITMAGIVSLSTFSVGYALFFSRSLFTLLATLLGLTRRWRKLDPTEMLEYLSQVDQKRITLREKNMERMFE